MNKVGFLLQAADLGKEIEDRRSDSIAQILGRSPVDLQQAERGLSAAGAADRILAALLSIPDSQERLATLPEAFVPPQPGAEVSMDTIPQKSLDVLSVCTPRACLHVYHGVWTLTMQERCS